MLRRTVLTSITLLLSGLISTHTATRIQTVPSIRQITHTPETALNLNPTLSDDGSSIFFESTVDTAQPDVTTGFQCVKSVLDSSSSLTFRHIASGRCISPATVANGSSIAFSSTEDLLNQNPDRNSEIYVYDDAGLKQLTVTSPVSTVTRLSDGNSQPSISRDGQFIVFASNRDLVGLNPDLNREIFLYDQSSQSFLQLTSTLSPDESTDPKISGDGKTIIFIGMDDQDESKRELKLYDRTASKMRFLVSGTANLNLSANRSLSDDGKRVVYSGETDVNQTQVFLFDTLDNSTEQLTTLPARSSDVYLNATISGDGKRVAFATRRRVLGPADGSSELYVYDIPSRSIQQITDAPTKATGEVVASMNFDGNLVAFSFPRVLTETLTDVDLANNSEIYLASVKPRAKFGEAQIFNAASADSMSDDEVKIVAPDSIISLRGTSLARHSVEASFATNQLPVSLGDTTVMVNGLPARLLFVSQAEIVFVMPSGLSEGPAEALATNGDGFASRAFVTLRKAAPGLFTFSGDGRGDGVVLNANNLTSSPLDPTDGRLRLIAFGTGMRNATSLTARLNGQLISVERVIPSTVPGLDEVHLLIPDSLRGAGVVAFQMTADDISGNAVRLTLGGNPLRDIMINEFLADPPDGLSGDANHDGVRSASADEFVELVNTTTHDIDISNYKLLSRGTNGISTLRHKFTVPTVLSAGTAAVVFGGGNLDSTNREFGGAIVTKASTGSLSLSNSSGSIVLATNDDIEVSTVTYGADTNVGAGTNQSVTRAPDITGSFTSHGSINPGEPRLFSPGTRIDGSSFVANPMVFRVRLSSPVTEILPGEKIQLSATAFDSDEHPLQGILFTWVSSSTDIVTIDPHGLATAVGPGLARLSATTRGVSSTPVDIMVSLPLPSPSPTPPVSPTPSPTPLLIPKVVISECRTRGPNGAGDEFVEIYNAGNIPIDIGGFKIKASNSSGAIGTRLTINSNTFLQPHSHFLATNSTGYSGTVAGDQSFLSGITNDGGIALTLPDDTALDQVGFSNGSAFKEGFTLAPLTSDADRGYQRKPGGPDGNDVDTNNNIDDFVISSPSTPQNLSSPPTPTSTPSPMPSPTPTANPLPSPTPTPSPVSDPSSAVVISQIFGGGGNTGAPYRNDFIELFNAGPETVSLSGWSVQYSGATSTTWSVTPLTSVSLGPGQYYLVQQSSGGSLGVLLPQPDSTGTVSMSASAGKVALVKSVNALTAGCPSLSTIVDLIGYGPTATCFTGAGPSPAPGNAIAIIRKEEGCLNSRNNANDFEVGAPIPRNNSSPISTCHSAVQETLVHRFDVGSWWIELASTPPRNYTSTSGSLLGAHKDESTDRCNLVRMRSHSKT